MVATIRTDRDTNRDIARTVVASGMVTVKAVGGTDRQCIGGGGICRGDALRDMSGW